MSITASTPPAALLLLWMVFIISLTGTTGSPVPDRGIVWGRDVSITAVWCTETTGAVSPHGLPSKTENGSILSIARWSRRRQATLPRFLSMSDPHYPSDSSAAPRGRNIPALDGLRGIAAMLVAGGHYMGFKSKGGASAWA